MTSRYSDSLRDGRSGDRISVKARFFTPVHTDPVAHPASYTIGIESPSRELSGQGVTLTNHPI